MKKNRLIYLTLLVGSGLLLYNLPGWMSSVIFTVVVCMPILSLLLTLPAICTMKIYMDFPSDVRMGQHIKVQFCTETAWPEPPIQGKLLVEQPLTGEKQIMDFPAVLKADHCGGRCIQLTEYRIHDYMGLFSLRLRKPMPGWAVVHPVPVAMEYTAKLPQQSADFWRPKPGGGFGENHELRPYREGDHLKQIHWKMTAKTGKLIYRETMIPNHTLATLQVDLNGTAEELDRKMGRLDWIGKKWVQSGISFYIRALTGDGVREWMVRDMLEMNRAMNELMRCPGSPAGSIREEEEWSVYIGGEPDGK